jgi:hypothetical protein
METHGQGAALVLCLGIAPPPESDGMAAPPPPPPPAQGLWHRVVSECLRREPVQHGQQLCQAGAGVRELLLALGEKALGETALGESRSEAVVAATLGGDGHEGWDLAVLSIVDGLGVLQQGVLDDLQLAIRALPAPTAASPSRRRRVLPGRVTVWAQLLSCKALRTDQCLRHRYIHGYRHAHAAAHCAVGAVRCPTSRAARSLGSRLWLGSGGERR